MKFIEQPIAIVREKHSFPATAPEVLCRSPYYLGPYRIMLNVLNAVNKVAIFGNDFALEPTLPEMSGDNRDSDLFLLELCQEKESLLSILVQNGVRFIFS